MKFFFNICIVIFVLISLYVVKDDLFSAYKDIKGYFENSSNIIEEDKQNLNNEEQLQEVNTKSETPGALKVISSVFSTTQELSNLTLDGVFKWTNINRQENGLVSLKNNTQLNISARKKLDDMFAKQYFEHVSPSGVGVGDLGKKSGYEYVLIGENLAMGNFKNDQAVLEAWMASPGHRANILNTEYQDIGIAVGRGMFEGKNVWLAVQHFGLPKSACPKIDNVLKSSIDSNQKILNDMQIKLKEMDRGIKTGGVFKGITNSDQIKQYNILVEEYNNLLNKVKKDIDTYNIKVKGFNLCVEKATT